MNCNKFESIASDLACGHLMEAGLRRSALAHTQSCARCAARLSNERLLTTALRAAVAEESRAAPGRVKANLLVEFKERAPEQTASPIKQRRLSRWAIAAAAILAIVAIPVIARLIQTGHATQEAQVVVAPTPKETTRTRASLIDSQTDSSGERAALNDPDAGLNETPARIEKNKRRVARKTIARANGKSSASEAMTEFIPLTYLAEATAIESGTVVRVEMARSTLLAMGLPVSVDRAGETIKADVVVGDDGLARAIRLIY